MDNLLTDTGNVFLHIEMSAIVFKYIMVGLFGTGVLGAAGWGYTSHRKTMKPNGGDSQ